MTASELSECWVQSFENNRRTGGPHRYQGGIRKIMGVLVLHGYVRPAAPKMQRVGVWSSGSKGRTTLRTVYAWELNPDHSLASIGTKQPPMIGTMKVYPVSDRGFVRVDQHWQSDPAQICPYCGRKLTEHLNEAGVAKHLFRCRSRNQGYCKDWPSLNREILKTISDKGPIKASALRAELSVSKSQLMSALSLLLSNGEIERTECQRNGKFDYYLYYINCK